MFNEFKKMVDACGDDVTLNRRSNGIYRLTLEDFEGFNENWHEVEREYDNEEAVDALFDWLETNCAEQREDFYTYYIFSDFQVIVGYASFDI